MLDEASFLKLQVCAVRSRWEELCDVFLTPQRPSPRRVGFPRFLLSWLRPDRHWPAAGGALTVPCTARYLTAAERVLRGVAGDADQLIVVATERRAGCFSLQLSAAGMEAAVEACLRTPPSLPQCAVVFAAGRRVLPLPPLSLLQFARLPAPQRLSDGALLLPAAPPYAVQRLLTLLQRAGAAPPPPALAAPLAELCRRLGGGQLAALLLAPQSPPPSGSGSDLPPPVFSPLPPDRKAAARCVSVRCRPGSGLPAEALLLLRAGVGTSVTLMPSDGVSISAHKLALCMYSPLIRRTFETLAAAALDLVIVKVVAKEDFPDHCSGSVPRRPRSWSGDGSSPARLPPSLSSPNLLVLPSLSAQDLHSMLDYIYGGETPAAPSTELFRRRMCAWIDFELLPMEIAAGTADAEGDATAAAAGMTSRRCTVKSESESPSATCTRPRPRKRRKTTLAAAVAASPPPPPPMELGDVASPAAPAATELPTITPLDAELIVYIAEENAAAVAGEETPADVGTGAEPLLAKSDPSAAASGDVLPPVASPTAVELDPLTASPRDSSADVVARLSTIAPLDADLTISPVSGPPPPPLPLPPLDNPDDPDYAPAEEVGYQIVLQPPRRRGGRPRRPLDVELTAEPVVTVEPTAADGPAAATATSRFTCDHCGKTMRNASNLADHVRTHTGERPFACEVCGKAFSSQSGLRHHEQTHSDTDRDCVCDVCGKRFTKHNLWSHMQTHRKPFLCAVCGQGFASQMHLKNHSVSQHDPLAAEHVCHECGRTFTQKGHLANHLRLHSDERRKFCTVCQRTWPSVAALQDHQALKHGDSGTVQCGQCDKTFRTLSSLRYHRRTHTGERPFQCAFCEKRFARPDNLQLHTRRHTGERPYDCTCCTKSFISKAVLNKHLAAHSEDSKNASSSSPPPRQQQHQEEQQPQQPHHHQQQQPHHQQQQPLPTEQQPSPSPKMISGRSSRPAKSQSAVLSVPVSTAASADAAAAAPEEAVHIETLSVQLPACLLEEAGSGEQAFTVDLQPGEPQFVTYL